MIKRENFEWNEQSSSVITGIFYTPQRIYRNSLKNIADIGAEIHSMNCYKKGESCVFDVFRRSGAKVSS